MRTLLVGGASVAIFGVVVTFAANLWLTANQRAEAEKPRPWGDPSFTTTAVTTGGMLARWMDNDGDLSNGHSYIKGIYELWKVRHPEEFRKTFPDTSRIEARLDGRLLPQLWNLEARADFAAQKLRDEQQTQATVQQSLGGAMRHLMESYNNSVANHVAPFLVGVPESSSESLLTKRLFNYYDETAKARGGIACSYDVIDVASKKNEVRDIYMELIKTERGSQIIEEIKRRCLARR